jgi:DNA-binding IclR family transcriptional regulator
VKLIGADPGITIPAMAAAMGIHANYLYKMVPSLEKAGKIRKDGHGWYPKAATPAGA